MLEVTIEDLLAHPCLNLNQSYQMQLQEKLAAIILW